MSVLESHFFNRSKAQLIFRGQRRFDWGLTPTLGRLDASGVVHEDIADYQIEYFRRAVRGRLRDNSLVDDDQKEELWSIGQHHGLMTPLLDWTHSPFVALFFAFVKENLKYESENLYRVIYVLNKTFIENDSVCPEIGVFEPKRDDHGRLVNQDGLFILSPTNNTIENYLIDSLANDDNLQINLDNPSNLANYICKIFIPNQDRDGCLRQLRKMNVHHASLFPDLQGASEYCNILVSEQSLSLREERLKEEDRKQQVVTNAPLSMQPITSFDENDIYTDVFRLLYLSSGDVLVDPARLKLITKELVEEFPKHAHVDWSKRESSKARLRNIFRAILRKYGYPEGNRNDVLDQIMGLMQNKFLELI